ncbi:Complement component C7 [Triplophysa tibetana]|uniref:Complement component C7 n=1 Tax=Triplophysa tibetana TaxID=1572043 RepID=A0A5A9NWA1_9TELE|nr:Complement component C7 [Triplophysa tibetana]
MEAGQPVMAAPRHKRRFDPLQSILSLVVTPVLEAQSAHSRVPRLSSLILFEGKCISQSLVCNGDQDCEEDGLDEQQKCNSINVCDLHQPPPNVELTGQGFDAVSRQPRGTVINTKSFGGLCRKTFSGDHSKMFRIPQNVLRYTFQAETNFVTLTLQSEQLVIIKSDVEVGQFQNQAPEYLSLSEEFWKALLTLPVVYNYAAYRNVLERFGTHYISEGTLGAHMRVFLAMNEDMIKKLNSKIQKSVKKTDIIGGNPGYIAKLLMLKENTPEVNGWAFSQWSGSVKEFPNVIKQKLRPLNELVKEVPCAGVKKYYLKRAIETYLNEKNPCHCRECQNNGLRVILDNGCQCVCKPGTEGKACELGTTLDEQPGVIHGDWACWSSWSSCREGQKSRTRSCSRPAPRGGKDCIGKAQETTACEDEQHLDYLRTMEPHCFDESLTPKESCKTPPALANGFVLFPKDEYLVGTKIEYTCIPGYHLIGSAIAECQENLKWLQHSKECKRTLCDPPKLPQDVTGRPMKVDYKIGEAITLSCPDGKEMEGPPEIQCNAGLAWSPQPKNIRSSLDVCATNVKRGQTQRLSVCKVQAMSCLGNQFTLANDSACQWPVRSSINCPHCIPWENCDDQTNTCRCKTKDECSTLGPWIHVCAQLEGASAPETMTECEAGVRKCRGETVRIVSVQPCQS